MKRTIVEGIGMLEMAFTKMSKGKTFFGGEDIGYLDIVVGCYLGSSYLGGLDLSKLEVQDDLSALFWRDLAAPIFIIFASSHGCIYESAPSQGSNGHPSSSYDTSLCLFKVSIFSMTKMCEMKLLGNAGSVFVTRVKFVLKLKSIDYEYIEEDLSNKSDLLRTSNPVFQRVPVLFHGNEPPMIESLAIMEYLDEIKPDVHPLLPSNPSDRVQYRILAYTFDNLCYPWIKEFMTTRNDKRKEELKMLLIEATMMLEEAFVKFSKGKGFFGGDDIDYLDIVVGSFLGWIKFYEIAFGYKLLDEVRNPRLIEWEKNMWSHEVASIIPSHETHIKFHKMLMDTLPCTMNVSSIA
ncbi:hypothetical protein QVD17_03578 [Tagetes erecta]|uniref:GST N-terminal domain-containing protein n=1 Tax=Tagetes erecta TaxID=13708 RepID=A0AAD8L8K5_TARER|nr:hypothetical protein QVD17_03578 [Tagetes erecta]